LERDGNYICIRHWLLEDYRKAKAAMMWCY